MSLAEGYAHYTINGHSLATAQAWAFAEAFAEASAVAKTCHKCLAASELLAHSYAEVFITAAKETEVYVSGVASGDHDRDEDDYTLIARDLVEKTMVAFAQVCEHASALHCEALPGPSHDNSAECTQHMECHPIGKFDRKPCTQGVFDSETLVPGHSGSNHAMLLSTPWQNTCKRRGHEGWPNIVFNISVYVADRRSS